MFDGQMYLLSIPLPKNISDEMNKLIYAIAEKSGEDPTKLSSKVQINSEFHVTLGVFHPHGFETHRKLFRHIVSYLKKNKELYHNLKHSFNGHCKIKGVGFHNGHKDKLADADVVWAAVESDEVDDVRTKMRSLLNSAGIDDKHFDFTEPHITLFTKKGDVHGISKKASIHLKDFLDKSHLEFNFQSVNFQKEYGKVVAHFGPKLDGKPSNKWKDFSKDMAKSNKKDPVYNWSYLFKHFDKEEALRIKQGIMGEGPGWLFKNLDRDKALEIKKHLGN